MSTFIQLSRFAGSKQSTAKSLLCICMLFIAISSCKKPPALPHNGDPDGNGSNGNTPTVDVHFSKAVSTIFTSLALDVQGNLWVTGGSTAFDLGLNTAERQNKFKKGIDQVKDISISENMAMVVRADGSVWTDGLDGWYGYEPIDNTPDIGGFKKVFNGGAQVEAGFEGGYIITPDHTLWGTGFNRSGELGSGNSDLESKYVKVMGNVQSISAGRGHILLVKTDGTLWVTGRNFEGELGLGDTLNREAFVKVMDGVKAAKACEFQSLVVKTDGSLWTAGDNEFGELGVGDTIRRTKFVKIMDGVSAVAGGRYYSLALKTDGSLWASGYNNDTFGITGPDQNKFIKVADGIIAVAATQYHSFIIKKDQTLWGTGENNFGEIGAGNVDGVSVFTKVLTAN